MSNCHIRHYSASSAIAALLVGALASQAVASQTGQAMSPRANSQTGQDVSLQAMVPKTATMPDPPASRKLTGQAEMLRQYDSSLDTLQRAQIETRSNLARLRARVPLFGVDRSVPLKGKVEVLSDGVKLSALKDAALFDCNPKHLVAQAVTANISDDFIRGSVYKAFVRMDCLEFADLGANLYTGPDFYQALQCGGRNIVIGAVGATSPAPATTIKPPVSVSPSGIPVLNITLAGKVKEVSMDLPGLNRQSQNVLVVTDGHNILSIDPKTSDTWKLLLHPDKTHSELSWQKLTHTRGKLGLRTSPM